MDGEPLIERFERSLANRCVAGLLVVTEAFF
jgi:hypothetical protein